MESLKYFLKKQALKGITNHTTLDQYQKNIDRFAKWAKESNHIRLATDVNDPQALVEEYVEMLVQSGKQPDTVHSYLAPVTKGFGMSLDKIRKPKRRASSIEKTRDATSNAQGRREMKEQRFSRVVLAAKTIGVRREELAVLTGDCLVRDNAGNLCVLVHRGKGGKTQLQRILPNDEQFVRSLFAGIEGKRRIFTASELSNKIPLHALRREHAQEAYGFYLQLIHNGKRQQLIEDLRNYFLAYHTAKPGEAGERRLMRQFDRFCADLEKDRGRYRLRGQNLVRAERANRPVIYDRVALMCASVFHLAHWRNDVTARNYMI